MGAIDLARATFFDGTPDTRLDILARWNLFNVGLNYRHEYLNSDLVDYRKIYLEKRDVITGIFAVSV